MRATLDNVSKNKFLCNAIKNKPYAPRHPFQKNEVWNQLQVGTPLRLVREADNRHDPNAVQVVFFDKENEENVLLGYIPSTHNADLAIFLDMGWGHLFECRITQIQPDAHPERQVQLVIKVKRNKA